MREYCRGFIDGYNSNLVPFIDTIDSRKEIILNEATKRINGFVEHHGGNETIKYHEEDFYETGIYEGKRYKAWEIIFETPGAFIEFFTPTKNEILKENSEISLSEIKWQAIFETNYFFSENYSIEPNPNQLDDLIQTFDKDIEINLKHNYELIKQGRKEDLKNELTTYIKGIEKLLIKYETNHLGCVSNPKPLNKVNAYCELKYYYLFHSHFLSILNTPEPTQPEQNTAKTSTKKKQQDDPKPLIDLIDLFEDVNRYHRVMAMLAGKYIDKDTHLYIRKHAGHKKEIVQLILCLHVKGYFKNNKRPTQNEIKQIAQKTFGVTIGPDTIKQNTEFRHAAFKDLIPLAVHNI